MGVEPLTLMAISAATGAGVAGLSYLDQRKGRKDAERQAALERQALANLEAKPPAAIPGADDAATRRARQRSISAQLRRRGRQSTILTSADGGDTLGA